MSAAKKRASPALLAKLTKQIFPEKRGPGRPKLAPEDRVVKHFFYAAPWLSRWIEAKAEESGMGPGPWIVGQLAQIAAREP